MNSVEIGMSVVLLMALVFIAIIKYQEAHQHKAH
jgi:hypothetical protein